MNENLNLVEILKDCPEGTELYSTIYGKVKLYKINEEYVHPISLTIKTGEIAYVTSDGKHLYDFDGDCTLFPSKEQRDWSKFMNKQSETEELCESQEITKWAYISDPLPKQSKFDPKTLQPFDKVLVRDGDVSVWKVQLFSHIIEGEKQYPFLCINDHYMYCIPYNDDTKHLIGTKEEAPEFYRYWEE